MPNRPTPPDLFDEFEAGHITRAQLHAGLAWHARELVEEIIEVHENPVAAWWDTLLAKRTANRWISRHGTWRIRHVLAALSKLPDFPPARFLWQALHADVPVHCFFRLRQRPLFRLTQLSHQRGILKVEVEFDDEEGQSTRAQFRLEHGRKGLVAEPLVGSA